MKRFLRVFTSKCRFGSTSLLVLSVIALMSAQAQTGPGSLLEDLIRPAPYKAARASSYDVSGGNADSLTNIQPGETRVLANIQGPGMISHIWCTVNAERWYGRKIVLRMYWDGEDTPSVLSPLNDFFAMGHGIDAPLVSLPITTTAGGRAKNCFWKMPFNQSARIEITNEGTEPIGAFYYYVDYRKYPKPFDELLTFHAHYRQEAPAVKGQDYLVCSGEGRGQYVGTVISYESHSDGWWGEGDDKFYVDAETTPSLHGTGSEDYLCDAWGIWPGSSPFYGSPIHEGLAKNYPGESRYTSYRFHIADPIPFEKSLRFQIEHWGAGVVNGRQEGFIERFDDISSVGFWYQTEPHTPMEPLAPVEDRLPREAESEKQGLKLKRLSWGPQTTATLTELVKIYEHVKDQPEQSTRESLLALDLAAAYVAVNQPDEATRLLGADSFPIVPALAVQRSELKKLISDRLTSQTALIIATEDGSLRRVKREGRPAFSTDGKDKRPYLYFKIPESNAVESRGKDVELHVSCYSTGITGDSIIVQYSSAAEGDKPGQPYRDAGVKIISPVKGWHTLNFRLPAADFSGRQNGGADFRIYAGSGGADKVVSHVEMEFVR